MPEAIRRFPGDRLTGMVTDEDPPERRLVGNSAVEWIRLHRTDDLEFLNVAVAPQPHPSTGLNLSAPRQLFDQLGAAYQAPELSRSRVQPLELKARVKELAIFGAVPKLASGADALGNLGSSPMVQLRQLGLNPREAFPCEEDSLVTSDHPDNMRGVPEVNLRAG